jgi:arylsulfatase A-like enzyme
VLIVTVDCLRADHVGAYGYERDTTPNIDALASRGALFERSYSHAPFTAPSHASLFTGLNTQSHGLVFWGHQLDPGARTFPEYFAAAGYETGAFQNHPGLPPTGLMDGFETIANETTGPWPDTVSNFFEWVDSTGEPFAAWVHLWDVHRPYGYRQWSREALAMFGDTRRQPGELPYGERGFGSEHDPRVGRTEEHYNLNAGERAAPLPLPGGGRVFADADWQHISDRYDNSVRYADEGVGALLRGLRERGVLNDTIVVITADHGETLTERDPVWFTHDPFLFDETLRVPLVIQFPGGRFANVREDALARGIDVLPTVLSAAGLDVPDSLQGRDLARVLDGSDTESVLLLAQTQTKTAKERAARVDEDGDGPKWLEFRQAVTDGEHKLIVDLNTGALGFYDLEADPAERVNLLEGREVAPPEAVALREGLTRLRRTLPVAAEIPLSMTPEEADRERRRLEALGYLDRDPAEGSGPTEEGED